MKVNIADFHPTQLYLSEKKLQDIQMLYQSAETIQVDPISILAFSAEWDRDGGDELYHLYAQACEERKIYSVFDLEDRILAQDGYEAKWYNWCDGFNQAATLLLKR